MLRILRISLMSILAGAMLIGGLDMVDAKPERPTYTVVSTEKPFEIRDYERMVVAQFTMRGSYRQSVSQGYIKLENYFMGENSVPEPIEMTVPAMVRNDLAEGWTTMFFLPDGYMPETAPRPVDRRIRVVEFPPRRVAVISFPGKLNDRVMQQKTDELKAWLEARGIAHRADFTLASYDTPWTPSSWRGNEVMVTLR